MKIKLPASLLWILAIIPVSSLFAQVPQGNYYRRIDINRSKIKTLSTDPYANTGTFPLLVQFQDVKLRYAGLGTGGYVIDPQGKDISFYLPCRSTPLNYEIETYNPDSGSITAWVQLPHLFADSPDTSVFMYYGTSVSVNPIPPTFAWDAFHKGVWHFNNNILDATANANHLVDSHSVSAPNNGKIGAARDLTNWVNGQPIDVKQGTQGKFLNLPNRFLNGFVDFTFQGWVLQQHAETSWERIFELGKSSDTSFYFSPTKGTDLPGNCVDNCAISTAGETEEFIWNNNNVPVVGTYNYWVITYDYSNALGGGRQMRVYKNGVLQPVTKINPGGFSIPLSNMEPSRTNYFGRSNYFHNADHLLSAYIDEFRILNRVLTDNEIATQYANQSSPQTFYTISDQMNINRLVLNKPILNHLPSDTLRFCQSDSVLLLQTSIVPNFGIKWSTGDTTHRLMYRYKTVTPIRNTVVLRLWAVAVANNSCTSDTSFITVKITPSPTEPHININGIPTLCQGESRKLKVDKGLNNFFWTKRTSGGIDSTISTSDSIIVSTSGLYKLKYFSSTCTTFASKNIVVYPGANVPKGDSVLFGCGNGSTVTIPIDSVPDTYYYWYKKQFGGPPVSAIPTRNFTTRPINNTNDSVVVYVEAQIGNPPSCISNRVRKVAYTRPLPNMPSVAAQDIYFCAPNIAVLNITSQQPVKEFRLYNSQTGGIKLDSSVSGNFTTPVLTDTASSFYITAFNGVCESSPRLRVTVHIPAAPVLVSNQAQTTCYSASTVYSFTATVSKAAEALLWVRGSRSVPETTLTNQGYTLQVQNPGTISHIDTITVYELRTGGCKVASDPFYLQVFPEPRTDLTLTGNKVVCLGNTGVYSLAGYPGSEYKFLVQNGDSSTGSSDAASFQFNAAGNYVLTAQETFGKLCAGPIYTLNISVVPNPAPKITGDSIICPERETKSVYSVSGASAGSQFVWAAAGADSFHVSGNTFSVSWNSKAQVRRGVAVTETTADGCIGNGLLNVLLDSTLSLPNSPCKLSDYPLTPGNVITPSDGDKYNPFFVVKNKEYYGACNVQVFNRWGKEVFNKENYDNQWAADDLPAGTYYYIVRSSRADIPELKGPLTIIK